MKESPTDIRQSFCTFRLDGHLFGVDIRDVREVTTETTSTPIAHAPDEVLGLVNIRGHIYLALDLRSLLGMPVTRVGSDSRLVLFKPAVGTAFGVVVDDISEIHAAAPDLIEPFSANSHDVGAAGIGRVDLITAVCRLPEELLVILNPRKFLSIVEQNFARSA